MTPKIQFPHLRQPPPAQSGFTLVEIMVGLAIGMLATVIIMQVFSVFEAQKRTTTGTADAQINGSIALYNIGRDLQSAGYPLISTTDSPLNCAALTSDGVADTPARLSPVSISNTTSDSITIRYGTTPMGGISTLITAAPVGNDVTVDSNLGCQPGDVTLAINGTSCALSSASAVSATGTLPVTVTLKNTTGAVAGGKLACLGAWNEIVYAVSNGDLQRNGEVSVPGIVNLQAQYGVADTSTSNQVTAWVDATGGWAAPTVADRNRIKAVRIAVVARNAKTEPADVTMGVSAWTGSASSPAPTVDLSADPNWKKYRYRVFETIIPLRNVIWSKDLL